MLLLFPFAAWLAAATSVVLLVMLWSSGDLGPGFGLAAIAWLLGAGYCQLSGHSQVMSMLGLAMQTLLAIAMIVRWRLAA
jgi:hypothetical protein